MDSYSGAKAQPVGCRLSGASAQWTSGDHGGNPGRHITHIKGGIDDEKFLELVSFFLCLLIRQMLVNAVLPPPCTKAGDGSINGAPTQLLSGKSFEKR